MINRLPMYGCMYSTNVHNIGICWCTISYGFTVSLNVYASTILLGIHIRFMPRVHCMRICDLTTCLQVSDKI